MRATTNSVGKIVVVGVVVLVLAALAAALTFATRRNSDALVVYCAHDAQFSREILDRFERETGIDVVVRFDTEASKSLGLVNRIIREKNSPRCDVFWNNQLLGTLDLQDRGLLLPYKGAGYDRIPARFRDPDGRWCGFAARMRVYIVNTDSMSAKVDEVAERMKGELSRMAVARPLYGTTRTHYTVLWSEMGADELKSLHDGMRDRGVREVAGNAAVKNIVAAGDCDFGWTDTDDFFVAKDDGAPVEMLPVRIGSALNGPTVVIPNTVAIIRGAKRETAAKRLVDFLLSAEIELALAKSTARQIPLGEVDESRLSDDVRGLKQWAADGYDLRDLGSARTECLDWLRHAYAP